MAIDEKEVREALDCPSGEQTSRCAKHDAVLAVFSRAVLEAETAGWVCVECRSSYSRRTKTATCNNIINMMQNTERRCGGTLTRLIAAPGGK